jgi:hypothetical protein
MLVLAGAVEPKRLAVVEGAAAGFGVKPKEGATLGVASGSAAASSAFFWNPPNRFCAGCWVAGSGADSGFLAAEAPKSMAAGLGVADPKRPAPVDENLIGVFAFQVLLAGVVPGSSLAGLTDLSLSGDIAKGVLACAGNCLTG